MTYENRSMAARHNLQQYVNKNINFNIICRFLWFLKLKSVVNCFVWFIPFQASQEPWFSSLGPSRVELLSMKYLIIYRADLEHLNERIWTDYAQIMDHYHRILMSYRFSNSLKNFMI